MIMKLKLTVAQAQVWYDREGLILVIFYTKTHRKCLLQSPESLWFCILYWQDLPLFLLSTHHLADLLLLQIAFSFSMVRANVTFAKRKQNE
jgi:hypothetical protein